MNIPEILEVQNLTGAVRKFAFPEEFLSQKFDFLFPDEPIDGDHAEIDVIESTARVPQYVSRGGSSIQRSMIGRSQILVRMPYIKESFMVPSDIVNNLRGLGTSKSMRAVSYVADELLESARAVARAKEVAIWNALSTDFNIVIDDSLHRIESPYPAENIIDLRLTAETWDISAAPIREHLKEWNRIVVRKTGHQLKTAFMNSVTGGYLLQNHLVQRFLAHTEKGTEMLTGTETYNLFGIHWIMWDQYFVDPWTGEERPYIPDNKIIFVPNTTDWCEYQVGEVAYFNEKTDAEEFDHGPVSFTERLSDPVGRKCYTLWCGLPVVKNPDAVIIAEVAGEEEEAT